MTDVARNQTPNEHVKPAVLAQAQPAVSPPETKTDARPEAKANAGSEVNANPKTPPKPNEKTDAGGDGKIDAKSDTKLEGKTEAKGDQKAEATPALALGSQAREVVSQVATQVATQAKELVTTRVAEQTDRGAGELGDVAKALRHTSRQLEGNVASPLVDKAAEQFERASEFLQTANPGQMAQAVQSFARREPLLFLGGAFAAGIVLARFLKSSGHREDRAAGEDHDSDGARGEHAPAQGTAASSAAAPNHLQHPQKRHARKHRRH